jgi:deoxycytidylate deaminase
MTPIELAIAAARRSNFERAPMGACLFRRRRILGVGHNDGNRYQGKIRTTCWQSSLHAEVSALLDALKRHDAKKLKGASIVVVRLNRHGELRLAKPCDSCMRVLTSFEIGRIIFSNSSGGFAEC